MPRQEGAKEIVLLYNTPVKRINIKIYFMDLPSISDLSYQMADKAVREYKAIQKQRELGFDGGIT